MLLKKFLAVLGIACMLTFTACGKEETCDCPCVCEHNCDDCADCNGCACDEDCADCNNCEHCKNHDHAADDSHNHGGCDGGACPRP